MSNVHVIDHLTNRWPGAVLGTNGRTDAFGAGTTPEVLPVALLDTLNLAAVIVDSRMRVQWASGVARQGHQAFGSLAAGSVLKPGTSDGAERLGQAVRSACAGRAGEVALHPATADAPLLVRVLPLRGLDDAFALLLIVDTGAEVRDAAVVEGRLSALFGLTPMEARVACRLANGDGMTRVASRLGIAVSTARTHAARCYNKTGVRRQAALARLANSLRQV